MRTDLDHLPPQKRPELERVVQIIFEELDDALALAKHQWKKRGRIEKIILYWSYARGGWVDERYTAKGNGKPAVSVHHQLGIFFSSCFIKERSSPRLRLLGT